MKNEFRVLWILSFLGWILSLVFFNTTAMLITNILMWVFLIGIWVSKDEKLN
jgi:hypothetical protein